MSSTLNELEIYKTRRSLIEAFSDVEEGSPLYTDIMTSPVGAHILDEIMTNKKKKEQKALNLRKKNADHMPTKEEDPEMFTIPINVWKMDID